jgi:hypothetical protein
VGRGGWGWRVAATPVGCAAYGRRMIPCDNCGQEFEPVRTRWLCPHCKYKASCCEGEPQ